MADHLYFVLVWHMHQPYYWNDEQSFFEFPWVRTHTTKDYLYMARVIRQFPEMKVTINFAPSLLKQFSMYQEGCQDLVMMYARKNAESLTPEELVASFADDRPFQRTLERKIKDLYGDRETLSSRHMKKIRDELLAGSVLKRRELVDQIISPLTAKDIRGEKDTLEIYDLVPRDDEGRRIEPATTDKIK
ncbi:MAG: hypothetical protein NTX88_00530, partial [Candidatus Atribacteria bacterium]|nr:hypothetical protein [Candidatus Atribacteria bacterium]